MAHYDTAGTTISRGGDGQWGWGVLLELARVFATTATNHSRPSWFRRRGVGNARCFSISELSREECVVRRHRLRRRRVAGGTAVGDVRPGYTAPWLSILHEAQLLRKHHGCKECSGVKSTSSAPSSSRGRTRAPCSLRGSRRSISGAACRTETGNGPFTTPIPVSRPASRSRD